MAGRHLEAAAAALQALDSDALVGLYADAFIFEDVAAGETITTREGLRRSFEGLFSMSAVAFSDVDFFQGGDRGAGTWEWSGTNQKGQPFSVRGASVFEVTDAGIRGEAVFYDPRPAFG